MWNQFINQSLTFLILLLTTWLIVATGANHSKHERVKQKCGWKGKQNGGRWNMQINFMQTRRWMGVGGREGRGEAELNRWNKSTRQAGRQWELKNPWRVCTVCKVCRANHPIELGEERGQERRGRKGGERSRGRGLLIASGTARRPRTPERLLESLAC